MKQAGALVLAILLLGAAPAFAAPDAYVARLEALALLQTLNADLLSHDSATAVLQDWCDAHGPGGGVKIVAQRVRGTDKPLSVEARKALGVGAEDAVRYPPRAAGLRDPGAVGSRQLVPARAPDA
ncbi:MAG: hypothetical protein WDN45_08465 [Caulobacteraceae bacterium]